jgi:flagellin
VKSGDIAEIIANKINLLADDTGVEATSSTQAMLSFENISNTTLSDTVSFNLYGIDGTKKHISSKINFGSGNQDMDLGPLRAEINNFSSQTGITAYISDDNQAITLKTRQGFDILIDDFNLKNDTNNVFMYLNEMKSSGQVSPSSLKLSQSSSGVNANDSARIAGEIIFKSHKHFSLNSSKADSILSLREKNLDFASLSTIAARSFETAKSSIDVIKFSMKSIAAEQSKVGGLANQLQETVRNLSHIRSLDQIAIGKIEDVDVAKTVVSLQKSNYIQQIATAMVNRVKSTMEAVLQMLERQ